MYAVIAILVFGVLIAVHEFGHFAVAKACGVKVNEYAIGMGPVIVKRQGKETLYSWRLLPIGGYCAMEGEDSDTGDPRAFTAQRAWKRFLILIAGSFANFLAGLIAVLILFSSSSAFSTPVISGFYDGFEAQGENGLMAGDTIYKINGKRINLSNEISMYLDRAPGGRSDVVVLRGGEKIELNDLLLERKEFVTEQGTENLYGLKLSVADADAWTKLKHSWYNCVYFVRLVWLGLSDLVSGAVGVRDLSGVVGIVAAINDVGRSAEDARAAAGNIAYFSAFIAVNLSVMNMLPIPALDGGRIFFLIVNSFVEKVFRKRVNPKYEGYVHAAGLFLLIGLMAAIMVNDLVKIIGH